MGILLKNRVGNSVTMTKIREGYPSSVGTSTVSSAVRSTGQMGTLLTVWVDIFFLFTEEDSWVQGSRVTCPKACVGKYRVQIGTQVFCLQRHQSLFSAAT